MPNFLLDYYFSLDTPAPTLGEAYYGAGQGISELAYVTVSTGIGRRYPGRRQVFRRWVRLGRRDGPHHPG